VARDRLHKAQAEECFVYTLKLYCVLHGCEKKLKTGEFDRFVNGNSTPRACSGVVRIYPLRFLVGYLKRRLNQV